MNEANFSKVVLGNSHLRVEVLPALGGKLSSLRLLPDGPELLQQPLAPYSLRDAAMGFDKSDASGWDECLPSVSACEVDTPAGRITIPDHGDFWRVAWKAEQQEDGLRMTADGFSLPLRFEKTLRLNNNALEIEYSVTNKAEYAIDYAWSAHPLFAIERGDRILLPSSVEQIQVEASNRLGPPGTKHAWPLAILADTGTTDLRIAGGIEDGVADKVYTTAPIEGWCALERAKLKQRISVRFDTKTAPFLGLWLCYGGWPQGGLHAQHCIALEPCTAPADSLATAIEKGWATRLSGGERNSWPIEISVTAVS